MNNLKRIFITMKSQIDSVADEFENHEALAGAAIKDLQTIGAKTNVQRQQVKTMINRHQKKLDECYKEAELWSSRAIKARVDDENRALECVKRLRLTRIQIKQLEAQLEESRALETKIQSDVNKIQAELLAMQNKKQQLSARQYHTQMNAASSNLKHHPANDVDDIFSRWENILVAEEFSYPETTYEDDLVTDFEQQEDEIELKIMLDELTETASTHVDKTAGEES
jgi:phage shock protein A